MTRISKNRPLEYRFWALAMDMLAHLGPVAHDAWLFALCRLSECVDWGDTQDWPADHGSEPW